MPDDSIKFLNRNWVLNVTRNISLFANAVTSAGYIKNYKKYNVLPVEAAYITKNGRLSYAFTSVESISKYSKNLEKFYKNPLLLKKLETTYYRYGQALMKEGAKLAKKITQENYESYVRAAKIHFTGFQPTNVIGTHFPKLLNEKIKNIWPELSQQELDILISDLTYPEKRTPLTQSQKALLQIGIALQEEKKNLKDIESDTNLRRKLNDYMRKFSFIPVNFIEEPWTRKEVMEQLKKLMKKDCQKELGNILKNDEAKKIKSRKLISEIKDREIKNLVKAIQVGTYLNEYRKYVACHASISYRPMLVAIAARYNLSGWRECLKFTPNEIEKLYFKRDKKVLKVLEARSLAGICFSKNKDGYRLMTKKEIALFLPIIGKGDVKKEFINQEIKGVIANKGIVRGIARIISGRNEFEKFQDGDIIVTAMTSVDFVPLMKRAAAYVTNEGGITSHAAIVSRELNKPCLVGTKNATEILKDGDLIEVDALEGIVRIIKRK